MEKHQHKMYDLGERDLEDLKMQKNLEINNTETRPLPPADRSFTSPETPAVGWVLDSVRNSTKYHSQEVSLEDMMDKGTTFFFIF